MNIIKSYKEPDKHTIWFNINDNNFYYFNNGKWKLLSNNISENGNIIIDNSENSDLDISDENGNVLARFNNGHLQVKNFSSDDAIESINAILSNIGFDNVPEFDEESHYSVGDIVRYGKYIYAFINEHTAGKWDDTQVERSIINEHPIDVKNNNSDSDLDITDEEGNILASFSNGHIKTKNFNSEDENIKIADSEASDLEISDENGNSILRIKDGHIQTKNFDSETGQLSTSILTQIY